MRTVRPAPSLPERGLTTCAHRAYAPTELHGHLHQERPMLRAIPVARALPETPTVGWHSPHKCPLEHRACRTSYRSGSSGLQLVRTIITGLTTVEALHVPSAITHAVP